jgi:hypothetical protein
MRILKELPVFNQRTNKEDPLVYSRSFDRFPLIESEFGLRVKTGSMISENPVEKDDENQ